MRTFPIEFITPPVELPLVETHVSFNLIFQLIRHVQVHSFMPTILLGMTRLDTVQLNPQSHPPNRKFGQSKEAAHMGKRGSIVGTNHLRQTELAEDSLEFCPYRVRITLFEGFNTEYVLRELIPNRQRIHLLLLRAVPPTFKIHRPHMVRMIGNDTVLDPDSGTTSSTLSFLNQPRLTQDTLDRRDTRNL